jgi:hypothetical protein
MDTKSNKGGEPMMSVVKRLHSAKNSSLLLLVLSLAVTTSLGFVRLGTATGDQPQLRSEVAEKVGGQILEDLIDGSVEPERIPDEAAFGVVFRVISSLQARGRDKSVRAYLEHIGFNTREMGQRKAAKAINAILSAAEGYNANVRVLDSQAEEMRMQSRRAPNEQARAGLAALRQQKADLARATITSLDERLGPVLSARVHDSISERVKPLIKIREKADR